LPAVLALAAPTGGILASRHGSHHSKITLKKDLQARSVFSRMHRTGPDEEKVVQTTSVLHNAALN
jgi:hypothetical protein